MMAFWSDTDIAAFRDFDETAMVTPCTVSRQGTLQSLTMPDGSALRCRVLDDTRETQVHGSAGRVEEQRRWMLTFPADADIRANDIVVALGNTYAVIELDNPSSWNTSMRARAYMVYDDRGVAVHLRANATISTSRGSLGRLIGVAARRDEPKLDITPDGQTVQTTYAIDGLPNWAVYADGTNAGGTLDLEEGDLWSELERPTGVVKLVTPFVTGIRYTSVLVVRTL
jgi:hypothetical protein